MGKRTPSARGEDEKEVKKTLILSESASYVLGLIAATRGVSESQCLRQLIEEAVTPEIQAIIDNRAKATAK